MGCGIHLYTTQDKNKLKLLEDIKKSLGFQCIRVYLDGLIMYYALNMSALHTGTQYLFYSIIRLLVN
jgi:hypothetical protein